MNLFTKLPESTKAGMAMLMVAFVSLCCWTLLFG